MERIPHCETHGTVVCACDLVLGTLQLRQAILCSVDATGRLYCSAPRRADALMARRVVATMAGAQDDVSRQLVSNLVGIREKGGR